MWIDINLLLILLNLKSTMISNDDRELIRQEMESSGWQLDCVDQASAIAARAIAKLQNIIMTHIRIHNSTGKIISINAHTREEWNALIPAAFLNIQEIIDDLMLLYTTQERAALAVWIQDDLIKLHHTFGQFIRNRYGLWHINNPLIIPGDPGDGHPDGISFAIIKTFHALCQEQNNAYNNAMSIIKE